MTLDQALVADLNVALDGATVQGVTWDGSVRQVRLLMRVLTLPAADDSRRFLVLSQVSALQILLRSCPSRAVGYGPLIPLPDQRALEEFLGSVAFTGGMYGGRALDDASPTDDWPAGHSLALRFAARDAPHCLYWFGDCTREEPGGTIGYRLEGLVRFAGLEVREIDGTSTDVRAFAEAGMRWWSAQPEDGPPPGNVGSWAVGASVAGRRRQDRA